ncbi:MAG: TetR/AcrR family transcriptional regulator [Myxococcota bacterium]
MPFSEATRASPRPPTQARSQRTRARLLEATIEALIELGYAGAKTTEIADRAGVSQGALYKHFPTKVDLLGEALSHLLAGLRARFDDRWSADPARETDPAGAVFYPMWDIFTSAELQAGFELYVAARTDRALASRVVPVIEQHRSRITARAHELFPVAEEDQAGREAIQALVATLQGAGMVGAVLPPDNELAATQRRSIERMFRAEFERMASQRRNP